MNAINGVCGSYPIQNSWGAKAVELPAKDSSDARKPDAKLENSWGEKAVELPAKDSGDARKPDAKLENSWGPPWVNSSLKNSWGNVQGEQIKEADAAQVGRLFGDQVGRLFGDGEPGPHRGGIGQHINLEA